MAKQALTVVRSWTQATSMKPPLPSLLELVDPGRRVAGHVRGHNAVRTLVQLMGVHGSLRERRLSRGRALTVSLAVLPA